MVKIEINKSDLDEIPPNAFKGLYLATLNMSQIPMKYQKGIKKLGLSFN